LSERFSIFTLTIWQIIAVLPKTLIIKIYEKAIPIKIITATNPLLKLDDKDSTAQTSEINKISFKSTV